MKPIENTENFVRRGKTRITTDSQMDKRVLDDSFAAMDERADGPNVFRMILHGSGVKLAAAAVIIVSVGLIMIESNPYEKVIPPTDKISKSPAEMLSVLSLSAAYRRGGIEAMDKKSNEAFEMLGSKPARVSIRELLSETNGV